MSDQTALLVDAKNALYRSIYAVRANATRRPDIKKHYFTAVLEQMRGWLNNMRPSSVHIFWDAPRETVWRRTVLPTYKDREKSTYVVDISEDLAATSVVAKAFFEKMGVRQYERKTMEADDLIYTAVSVMHPAKTVIVSSDSDMLQMPYRFNSCSVFNPENHCISPVPTTHPVYLKSIKGDVGDNIKGYYGIGPVKGTAMVENKQEMYEYFKIKGKEIFKRNLVLIDLSLCPFLPSNTLYVHKKLAEPVQFVRDELSQMIITHKVHGLLQDFTDLVLPFKNLV